MTNHVERRKRYFFCGIGGNGMSPLARLVAKRGHEVCGSDRSHDQGTNAEFFQQLEKEGIELFPQDSSGVDKSIDQFVFTRAVEELVPDIARAKELGIPMAMRPTFMAELFSQTENVAVAGTSGKSTTTGMIGYILERLGLDPTIVNGAVMLDYGSNILLGQSRTAVFEADESDGANDVVGLCRSQVAVLTNISLDHFQVDQLVSVFGSFVKGALKGAVLNADCPHSVKLKNLPAKTVTFGVDRGADITLAHVRLNLSVPGIHNVANALAAVAACSLLGIEPQEAADKLIDFRGIKRRLEVVGSARGVTVVDDFASNPGKIAATLKTLQEKASRLFVVFQPHGFHPTKLMKDGYIEVFASLLRSDDALLMPEIYYAGGTVNIVDGKVVPLQQDISSQDLVGPLAAQGINAQFFPERAEIPAYLDTRAAQGDWIVVMGSRDVTLPTFAREILRQLQRTPAPRTQQQAKTLSVRGQ